MTPDTILPNQFTGPIRQARELQSPGPDYCGPVVAGFSLPWNTTRTMADVWADEKSRANRRRREDLAEVREAAAKTADLDRARRFVTDHQNRPMITPKGKIAYAGRGKS
jgi:hypothetical protein